MSTPQPPTKKAKTTFHKATTAQQVWSRQSTRSSIKDAKDEDSDITTHHEHLRNPNSIIETNNNNDDTDSKVPEISSPTYNSETETAEDELGMWRALL